MTTTGRTTACSAKRKMAFGSERRTDVSRTYVLSACLPFASAPSFGLFFASGLASWGTCTPSPGAVLPSDVLTRDGHVRLKTNLCGRLDRATCPVFRRYARRPWASAATRPRTDYVDVNLCCRWGRLDLDG